MNTWIQSPVPDPEKHNSDNKDKYTQVNTIGKKSSSQENQTHKYYFFDIILIGKPSS